MNQARRMVFIGSRMPTLEEAIPEIRRRRPRKPERCAARCRRVVVEAIPARTRVRGCEQL
jgi:hypothetical protein